MEILIKWELAGDQPVCALMRKEISLSQIVPGIE